MIAVGLLLLAAAGLKTYGLTVAPVAQTGRFSSPTYQAGLILGELLLGIWLVAGFARLGAWLSSCLTFAAFAVISGYQGWIGVATCGCFGQIAASPWAAFGLDLGVLGLLALARPNFAAITSIELRAGVLNGLCLAAGTLAVLLAFSAAAVARFGSVDAGVARLQGQTIVAPNYIDFETFDRASVAERTINITNAGDRPVRIIGGTSDCSCIATRDLPVELAPGATVSLVVMLQSPPSEGLVTRSAHLLIDDGRLSRLTFRVGARVR